MGPRNLVQEDNQQMDRPEDPLSLGKTCTHFLNEDDLKMKKADSSSLTLCIGITCSYVTVCISLTGDRGMEKVMQ
jgi:hypothetical protein